MRKTMLCIPHVLRLASSRGWQPDLDDRKRASKFFVSRWHFVLEIYPLAGETHRGETLGAYRSPAGSQMTVKDTLTKQLTTVDLERTIQTACHESQVMAEMSAVIKSEVKAGGLSVGSELATKLQSQLKKSLSRTSFFERAETTTESAEWAVEFVLPSEQTQESLVVACYKRRPIVVYLSHVDYLFVNYDVSMFGFRRKRSKHPVAAGNGKLSRPNVIDYGRPVVRLETWEALPKSGWVVREDELKAMPEVPDVAATERKEPGSLKVKGYYKSLWRNEPSLYQMAEAAFPLKWTNRRGDWTKGDLLKIEADEACAREKKWGRRIQTDFSPQTGHDHGR